MKLVRLLAEVTGITFTLLSHAFLWLLYSLGGSLREIDRGGYAPLYWSFLLAGYVASGVVFLVAVRRLGGRFALDAWLACFAIAFCVSLLLVVVRMPLALRGWDAHGMGAGGGEANSAFLPWIQFLLVLFLVRKIHSSVECEPQDSPLLEGDPPYGLPPTN